MIITHNTTERLDNTQVTDITCVESLLTASTYSGTPLAVQS